MNNYLEFKNNEYSIKEEYQEIYDNRLKNNQKLKQKISNLQGDIKGMTMEHVVKGLCNYCKVELPEKFVAAKGYTSPSLFLYCSQEHAELDYKETHANIAELDQNASDSECFEHIVWKDNKNRTGRCKITGVEYTLLTKTSSENSGQPKECTEHFELKEQYKKYL